MKNIAVMVSGHPKGFDLTHQYFKHWNTLYEDVNFDFFVSVWENDYDESIFDWTTKYEFLKESECPYDLSKHTPLKTQQTPSEQSQVFIDLNHLYSKTR